MKTRVRTARFSKSRCFTPVLQALVVGACLTGAATAIAQDVVAPPPADVLVPQAQQQALLAQNVIPSAAVPAFAPDTPIVQSGPFTVRAHFNYRFLYGDGIPSENGAHLTTAIHTLTPDLLVDLGTHWTLDYAPSWVLYSNSAFRDSVDESVRLDGWTSYEDWVVRTDHSYLTTTSPLIEIGEQAKQVYWSNEVSGTYSFNSQMALELEGMHSFQSAEQFVSSHEWSSTDWLHYKVVPHVDTSIGVGIGYVDVSAGADMNYVRPQVRISWNVTNKISATIHGGEESRHFLSGGTPNLNTPIYGASVVYQPIETTKLTFGNERAVSTAFFEGAVIRSTTWNAQLEQRLFQYFYLTVGGSKQESDYLPLAGSLVVPRNDNSYSFDAKLSTTLFRRCSVSVLYQGTHNSSNIPGFGLASKQYGFEIGYRY